MLVILYLFNMVQINFSITHSIENLQWNILYIFLLEICDRIEFKINTLYVIKISLDENNVHFITFLPVGIISW